MKKYLYPVILFLFCMLCLNVFASTNPDGVIPPRKVTPSGLAFEYIKTGSGNRTVIFIPGFACSGQVWNETRQSFEKDFTCYTLTMAGFAGVAPQQPASFNDWTESIAKFIRDEKFVKPVIVGHSMGGALAMAVAAKNPGLVERIVVVDALPCIAAMMNPEFNSKEHPDCSEIVKLMTQASDEEFYKMQKQIIASMVADTSRHEEIISWSLQSDRKACAEMFCDFSNTDLRETIQTITCPTLVLLESYFVNFKPAIEAQYSKLSGVQLQYANKGLHFIMFDDPKWFMDQLHEFIH